MTIDAINQWMNKRGAELRDRVGLMTELEFSSLVEAEHATVVWWRNHKRGPKYVKLGQHIFYRWEDVLEWLTQNTHDPAKRVARKRVSKNEAEAA
jgi:hypothetical protein